MADCLKLEEDASYFARLAVQYDTGGQYEQAKFFYMVRNTASVAIIQFPRLWL